MILRPNEEPVWLDAYIARTEHLLADLRRIRSGAAPTAQDLAGAPLLEGFFAGVRRAPYLHGHVCGHPLLGTQDIVTSDLIVLAPAQSWARTASRFYRLGQPG